MKLSAGIVLASGTASLASMRDHPPRHLKHMARFADGALFTHVGGSAHGKSAPLEARQAPAAGAGAGAAPAAGTGTESGAGAGAGAGGPPAVTSAGPAFQSTSFYAPLNFSPSMPDPGYNPPTYPPSTATGGAGAPPAGSGPPGAGATGGAGGAAGGPPSYGGWGPKPSGGPPASGGPPSGGAEGPPAGSWLAPPAEESCSSGTEVWGGHTYTATSSPPGQPTGWGGSSPGGYSPPPPSQPTAWSANSTAPAPTSTWQTSTAPGPSKSAPAPDNGGWDQGPGTAGGNKPSYQNTAAGLSTTSIGALVSLCAVALAAAFL